MNFLPMLWKELKELARSYKLLFVPLVFVVLGLGQPIAYKLMPLLLKNSNLPEGATLNIPVPPPNLVVGSALEQYNQLGIVLLLLVVMGAIAGERASGVAATVLSKPVGRGAYLSAKAVAYSLLALVSLGLGIGLTAYYTGVLFGPVSWGRVVGATFLYLPYLITAVAVGLFFSSFLPSGVAAGGSGPGRGDRAERGAALSGQADQVFQPGGPEGECGHLPGRGEPRGGAPAGGGLPAGGSAAGWGLVDAEASGDLSLARKKRSGLSGREGRAALSCVIVLPPLQFCGTEAVFPECGHPFGRLRNRLGPHLIHVKERKEMGGCQGEELVQQRFLLVGGGQVDPQNAPPALVAKHLDSADGPGGAAVQHAPPDKAVLPVLAEPGRYALAHLRCGGHTEVAGAVVGVEEGLRLGVGVARQQIGRI